MDDIYFADNSAREEIRSKFHEWIECGKCRALMFDTFTNCWSCGTSVTGKNRMPVRL